MTKQVAVISDVVMKYGGAERVLEAFLEMYPRADLYTLFIAPTARKRISKLFPKVRIKTSIWQIMVKTDRVSKYISIIKLWSWIYWELLDLSSYDLVISSSHSFMSKNVRTKNGSLHLSYIHTPPRYLYDEFNEIGWIKKWPISWLFYPVRQVLRVVDKVGAQRPSLLVANSRNVESRIRAYYGRGAVVVYPPVEVELKNKGQNYGGGDYYVWVSRVVKQKGVALAVETCEEMGRKLVVVGNGDELSRLRDRGYRWVKFVRDCVDTDKYRLMSGARALIYTSIEEDFGIVPVESLKLGVPVIARASGGVIEVVKDGVNGVLYGNEVGALSRAISVFEKRRNWSREECQKSVKNLGKNIFKKNIRRLLDAEKNK